MRELVPSTIFVEAWVVHAYVDGCGWPHAPPLANQSSSLSRILALARETEWDGLSRLMWLETSE